MTTIDLTKAPMTTQAANNFETTQPYGLFYDWFCKDSSLPNRSKRLASRVRSVMKANQQRMKTGMSTDRLFDPDKVYVFFKNNCPAGWGPLYDDFRICDIKTGDVLFTVIPSQGEYQRRSEYGRVQGVEYHAELWGASNDFDGALVTGSWQDILDFFSGVVKPESAPAPKPKVPLFNGKPIEWDGEGMYALFGSNARKITNFDSAAYELRVGSALEWIDAEDIAWVEE